MGFLDYYMPGLPRYIDDEPDMALVERIRGSVEGDDGQALDSSMLLPCPFCGGRPYVQTFGLGDACWEARAVCRSCHVATAHEAQSWRVVHAPTGEDITRLLAVGKAVSAWNRRAAAPFRKE